MTKTNVVYIAAEGQGGITMRIDAWQEHHRVRLEHCDLLTITQPVNLMDAANVTTLVQYLKRIETEHNIHFGALFIDTYSHCIAGADENSAAVASAATAAMIRIRRELGITVVFVHHTGKDLGRGMRGSDALRGSTDGAVEIKRASDEGMECRAIVVRHKDAAVGVGIDSSLLVVPIPRLKGQEVDSSLVCTFPTSGSAEVERPNAMTRMTHQHTRRKILSAMAQGRD